MSQDKAPERQLSRPSGKSADKEAENTLCIPISKNTRQALTVLSEHAAMHLAGRAMNAPDDKIMRDTKILVDCVVKMERLNLALQAQPRDQKAVNVDTACAVAAAKEMIANHPEFIDFQRKKALEEYLSESDEMPPSQPSADASSPSFTRTHSHAQGVVPSLADDDCGGLDQAPAVTRPAQPRPTAQNRSDIDRSMPIRQESRPSGSPISSACNLLPCLNAQIPRRHAGADP